MSSLTQVNNTIQKYLECARNYPYKQTMGQLGKWVVQHPVETTVIGAGLFTYALYHYPVSTAIGACIGFFCADYVNFNTVERTNQVRNASLFTTPRAKGTVQQEELAKELVKQIQEEFTSPGEQLEALQAFNESFDDTGAQMIFQQFKNELTNEESLVDIQTVDAAKLLIQNFQDNNTPPLEQQRLLNNYLHQPNTPIDVKKVFSNYKGKLPLV